MVIEVRKVVREGVTTARGDKRASATVAIIYFLIQLTRRKIFLVKRQTVNISGFSGYTVPVETTQLRCCNAEATTDNMQTNKKQTVFLCTNEMLFTKTDNGLDMAYEQYFANPSPTQTGYIGVKIHWFVHTVYILLSVYIVYQ